MLHNALAAGVLLTTRSNNTTEIPLTTNEALSGIFGSVSLACWVFLLLPQLLENYHNQSAEAISLGFVIIWFLGDVANLVGAVWASLVPSIIIIGIWFCISDGLLITQCLYYGIRNKRREGRGLLASVKHVIVETETGTERFPEGRRSIDREEAVVGDEGETNETEPLLSRTHSRTRTDSYTIPGSADPAAVRARLAQRINRRKSSSAAPTATQTESLPKIFEEPNETVPVRPSTLQHVLKIALPIMGVILVGALGWFIAYKAGAWHPTPPPDTDPSEPNDPDDALASPAAAQFLGYVSAVLYLTARLPQIYKNYREKSTEGLSILFFILSLMGNASYGGAVLAHSLQKAYVLKNLPWLIGSLGTIAEDMLVFWQFRLYNRSVENREGEDAGDGALAVDSGAMAQRERGGGDETIVVGGNA